MADPLYVRARAALLDAAEALEAHRDALVLVGAQAVYLHTGDADLAVAEYTTDADFAVAPADLAVAEYTTDADFAVAPADLADRDALDVLRLLRSVPPMTSLIVLSCSDAPTCRRPSRTRRSVCFLICSARPRAPPWP